jgi:hypothetical protein
MDEIRELQQWYLAQCDGDWEHEWGVQIGTLDNPGWVMAPSRLGDGSIPIARAAA